MGDDDAKRLILARRARFVAAAVASLSVASCNEKPSPARSDTGGPTPAADKDADPSPTWITMPVGDASTTDAALAPSVCLSIVAPPADTDTMKQLAEDGGVRRLTKSDAGSRLHGAVVDAVTIPAMRHAVGEAIVPGALDCYRALRADAKMHGVVMLKLKLASHGAVTSAEIAMREGLSPHVAKCMANVALRATLVGTTRDDELTVALICDRY